MTDLTISPVEQVSVQPIQSITVNGATYPLHFGIDFIREMDKRHNIDANGMPYGVGLQSAVLYLSDANPVILEDIILSATHTLPQIPSKQEIEQWIEGQVDNLEDVFEGFLLALKTAPMTKVKTSKLLAAMGA